MDMIKLLDDAEKAIATLMLEVNRLNDEIILKDKQIEALKLRDLTDEQMLEVYKKCLNLKNKFKDNEKRTSYFNFAKAVLRKASEK